MSFNSNTNGVTNGAATANPSGVLVGFLLLKL